MHSSDIAAQLDEPKLKALTKPLTRAEAERVHVATKELGSLRRDILHRRGGRPLTASWPSIRAAREERARRA